MKAGDGMKLPEFAFASPSTVGIHLDPRTAKNKLSGKSRWVTSYELKFFVSDFDGSATINGTTYPTQGGYFLCAKPGQTLKMVMPYRCYQMSISTQDEDFKKALDALPSYARHPEMPRILELCKKSCHVDQRNTLNAKFELCSYVTTILTLLLRQYPDALVAANESSVRRHEQVLTAANRYLQTHFAEEINLETLAKDSGLHPTYFQKLFTEAFGVSPAQKLTSYRLSRARALLHDDSRPISEIARMCGFTYQSYFSRVFKQTVKQTPSQYRQTLRKRRLATKKADTQ